MEGNPGAGQGGVTSAPAGSTLGEQFLEQLLRARQALRRENHRLGFADRILDQLLGMQPVHRVPVERLPRARTVVKPQPSKRQYSIVDPIGVDVHDRLTVQQDCDHATHPALSSMAPSCGARRMLTIDTNGG